jgi:TPR repeat protein
MKAAIVILGLCLPALADVLAGVQALESGDYTTALRELLPLARQGDSDAQRILGDIYDRGQGVPQDYSEAARWYRLAADQGDFIAQYHLGVRYSQGQGVSRNYSEAARWYRLAADQGHATAQYDLGIMYDKGQGVPQDYIRAHMWFNLAGSKGLALAIEGRDMVAKKMTPGQIAEAQRLAREWKPKGSR